MVIDAKKLLPYEKHRKFNYRIVLCLNGSIAYATHLIWLLFIWNGIGQLCGIALSVLWMDVTLLHCWQQLFSFQIFFSQGFISWCYDRNSSETLLNSMKPHNVFLEKKIIPVCCR